MNYRIETKFKKTEFGPIPEDWEIKELNKIGKIVTGKTPSTRNKEYFGKLVPFITPRDMFNNKFIKNTERYLSKEGGILLKNIVLPKNSICVSCIGSDMGKVAINRYESITNQQINSIILKNLNYNFVYYSLSYLKKELKNLAYHSTAIPILNKSQFSKIKIYISSTESEVNKISEILSCLDDKIELNNKINSILEQISQTIFKHWFIDFEFPNEQGKPYKSSGGEFVDSGLGKIPKGWEVLYLKDVLGSLESGSRPKGGVDVFSNGIPSIGAENILGLGVYDYSKTKYVPEDFYNSMKTGKIINGDVLLYKDGAKIGRKSIFMFGFPFRKCCVNEHVFILRSNEKVTPIYLYFWLEKPEITNFIINLNSNSAQPGLNRVGVESVKILKPEAKILNKFNSILVPIFEKIFLNCLQNQTLSQVRDTLLPKLITGKIRLI